MIRLPRYFHGFYRTSPVIPHQDCCPNNDKDTAHLVYNTTKTLHLYDEGAKASTNYDNKSDGNDKNAMLVPM